MKIISWNVNGLRANVKKGGFAWLLAQNADIICLQETKAHPDQLSPEVVSPQGYFSYFDHSKTKKGYSGVSIYLKTNLKNGILKVEYGFGNEKYDQEGRQIAVFLKDFTIINTYFPNGGGGPERLKFKLEYYDIFLNYLEKIRKTQPNIIFCGDVNTAHEEIDLARPKENKENTGFLPIERAWIDKLIDSKYVDTFRISHPDTKNAYTYWDMKTFARERNVGWRIDYFFVTEKLMSKIKKSDIENEVLGSDHCPIFLEM